MPKPTKLPDRLFVICHDKAPIVAMPYDGTKLPLYLLDDYAEQYAMERKKLTYAVICTISGEGLGALPRTNPKG